MKNTSGIYELQAKVAQSMAHPIRMAVLDCLKDREQCVCDIAQALGTERSNLSKHLSIMVAAGVLESRKEGLKVMYKLRAPCVLQFVDCITVCLKENALAEQKILNLV